MLMNVKMPTIVDILTFISMKDTLFENLKAGKGLYFLAFRFFRLNISYCIYIQMDWTQVMTPILF